VREPRGHTKSSAASASSAVSTSSFATLPLVSYISSKRHDGFTAISMLVPSCRRLLAHLQLASILFDLPILHDFFQRYNP